MLLRLSRLTAVLTAISLLAAGMVVGLSIDLLLAVPGPQVDKIRQVTIVAP